ncbi:DUF5777 family beta-barrel protein [Pseudozobellia sp. WGM2]|uniref:DUF5777 family beta-barrel protein n=1 Tax=Pseudozobellia sp. WGM2 TaxID=2787625 RepID=UPI001ADF4722|nr:DUF5777 family beta-barrel protein [Pseudozobellia sp. WGM2]
MKINRYILLSMTMFCGMYLATAQDLLEILDKELPDTPQYTQATFKANRITFGQSVETRKKGTLEIMLGTKYWNRAESSRRSFASDLFTARIGLEYAFTDRFTFGAGVTSFDGIINGLAKYRLVRQRDDTNKSPISITLFQSTSFLTRSYGKIVLPEDSSDRFNYVSKVIFARKFDRNFSLQLSPTYIHANSRQLNYETNDFFAMGFAGRYKLSNHVSLASEYHYVAGRDEGLQGYNSFGLGVNWEVSDLILQFSLTNAVSFDEAGTILFGPENFNFQDGALHIGVSATYIFHLKKQKLRKD